MGNRAKYKNANRNLKPRNSGSFWVGGFANYSPTTVDVSDGVRTSSIHRPRRVTVPVRGPGMAPRISTGVAAVAATRFAV
jgi:hypothetical protein